MSDSSLGAFRGERGQGVGADQSRSLGDPAGQRGKPSTRQGKT